MAEFCLDCMNKYAVDKKLTKKDVIMDIDLCEGCTEFKPCVIVIKEKNIKKRILHRTVIPFRIIIMFLKDCRYFYLTHKKDRF